MSIRSFVLLNFLLSFLSVRMLITAKAISQLHNNDKIQMTKVAVKKIRIIIMSSYS